MARIAQPLEKAKLKGAHKKDPQRYKGEVPKNESPLGLAPAYMGDEAKAVWFELESYAIPGVLTAADRYFMEIAANLFAEYRRDPFEFPGSKYAPMIQALARLGMSPADRQKLTIDAPKKKNKFSGVM